MVQKIFSYYDDSLNVMNVPLNCLNTICRQLIESFIFGIPLKWFVYSPKRLRNERIVLSTEMNEKILYVVLLNECFDIFICKRQQKYRMKKILN